MIKQKDTSQFFCLIASLVFMVFSYIFLANLYLAVFNGFCFFYILLRNVVSLYQEVKKRIKTFEKFRSFTNRLIMQLSVTPNINDAFKEITKIESDDYSDVLLDESLLIEERLDNLDNYFPLTLYGVLKQILLLYIEQGGNILEMSQLFLNKCDLEYANMQEIFSINQQKWSECLVMWGFTIFGFGYLRSALISYYLTLIKNFSFVVFVELFIILFLVSLSIVSKKYLREQI